MNEILSIVLCFVSGVVVTSIIMVILGIKNEINGLKQQINIVNSFQRDIETLYRENGDIRLVIDEKIANWASEIYRNVEMKNEEIKRAFEDTYRYVDSRHDKLENKLVDIVKNGCEPAKSK